MGSKTQIRVGKYLIVLEQGSLNGVSFTVHPLGGGAEASSRKVFRGRELQNLIGMLELYGADNK